MPKWKQSKEQSTNRDRAAAPAVRPRPIWAAAVSLASDGTFFYVRSSSTYISTEKNLLKISSRKITKIISCCVDVSL